MAPAFDVRKDLQTAPSSPAHLFGWSGLRKKDDLRLRQVPPSILRIVAGGTITGRTHQSVVDAEVSQPRYARGVPASTGGPWLSAQALRTRFTIGRAHYRRAGAPSRTGSLTLEAPIITGDGS